MTEKEYLKEYSIEKFDRPSVTADVVTFTIRNEEEGSYRRNPESRLHILLTKREWYPYKGCWGLPGGFLTPGETVEECALREMKQKTGVQPVSLVSVGTYSEVGRDPRGWIISNAFAGIISSEMSDSPEIKSAKDAKWFLVKMEKEGEKNRLILSADGERIEAVLKEKENRFGRVYFNIEENGGLAFDHAGIIGTALAALRNSAAKFEMIFDFLPEKFTLSSLQKVQETILNTSLTAANFRRKALNYVEETEERTEGAGHRPALLYKSRKITHCL